jgi:hypothetical protein
MLERIYETTEAVVVGTSLTKLIEKKVGVHSWTGLNIEVENIAGGSALNSFVIKVQDHPGGEFYNFLGDTDFDRDDLINMRYSTATGPHELPAGQKAHVHVLINSAHAFQLWAKVAAGTASVKVRGAAAED